MTYERDEAMRQQEATEAMIRMREPRSSGPHPDPRDELIAELLAALSSAARDLGATYAACDEGRPIISIGQFRRLTAYRAAIAKAEGRADG